MDNIPKIFISHSSRDNDLLEDFIGRFKTHNDVQLLFDHQGAMGKIDEILLGYAAYCDLALLLINARFLKSKYCNDKELPILKKRASKREVLILPVLYEFCNFQKWNNQKDNGFLFFQAYRNQYLNSRGEGENADAVNSKLIPYAMVHRTDRELYHSNLAIFIQEQFEKLLQTRNLT
ncbi:MAG: hypothetical protein H6558_18620 [Lewinellaceae bacterium]|nr:hypothetical protein [Lewinellaceae bacterium]